MSVTIQIDPKAISRFSEQQLALNANYDSRKEEYDAGSEKVQWVGPKAVAENLSPLLQNFRHHTRVDHVDIGCGTGAVSKELRNHTTGLYTVGIDPSHGILERAVELGLVDEAHQRLATQLDILPDGSADVVTCVGVLDHLNEEEASIVAQEFLRVVRPGGIFAVTFEAANTEFPGPKSNTRFDSQWLAEQFSNSGNNTVSVTPLNPAWFLGKNRRPVENQILVGRVPHFN